MGASPTSPARAPSRGILRSSAATPAGSTVRTSGSVATSEAPNSALLDRVDTLARRMTRYVDVRTVLFGLQDSMSEVSEVRPWLEWVRVAPPFLVVCSPRP